MKLKLFSFSTLDKKDWHIETDVNKWLDSQSGIKIHHVEVSTFVLNHYVNSSGELPKANAREMVYSIFYEGGE